ncbi:Oidioi.mRNA.OKI2018_I69.chr1.g1527.t1.cds [Oikopleura dioica]|uniref:Oidioi.mRNA.OKI2018_I69.chr1.g1527.t1.cds n=1 Tax=Oikopleura dioica TaxID=34765 RepID=A0ABN7SNP8_OIKDI|nr:Oidioi.mRNA.OKI2018_I69.chr1.g1527.t1.cds [Oikopleura dioica]
MFVESEYVQEHFKTFQDGIWTAFVFLTMDGWRMNFQSGFDFYDYGKDTELGDRELIFIFWYFVNILLIILFSIIMNSMIVARVVTNLDNAMLEQDAIRDSEKDTDDQEEKKPTQVEENNNQMDDGDEASLIFMANHPAFQKLKQKPLFKTGLGNMNIDRVEDVLMIINALERNLREYTRIREKLCRIMEEMQILNDPLTTNNEALRVLACTAAGQELRESANLTGPLSYRQSQSIRQSMSKSIIARQTSVMRHRM